MMVELYDHQKKALDLLKTGSILCGGVGSGKSRTALAYYFTKECGGDLSNPLSLKHPKDLYIITTARKRDTLDWEEECTPFLLSTNPKNNMFGIKIVVDSWNNIKKYVNVQGAFFIFDEQRVIGYGAWTKAFLKITKVNNWILLTATPGDTWTDYIPVFIANGFYKNKTDFTRRHVVYSRFTKYPKIERYLEVGRLLKLRNQILVNMDYTKKTEPLSINVVVEYDKIKEKRLIKDRWNIFEDKPIKDASELCFLLRRLVNTDPSRILAIEKLVDKHPKVIIFYNFNYELALLRDMGKRLGIKTAEWNGHKHETIPKTKRWIYLVQYIAGAEGWNCIETNVIVFYSQNYSYRTMVQAAGRIDRLNTPFTELYYYHITTTSKIDLAIAKALKNKKNFNAKTFRVDNTHYYRKE